MRLYRHLSVFLFAALPVYSFIFWWCFPDSPSGVKPPALPSGLAWGCLPFFCGTMPSDLPCTIVLDVSKFPAAPSRVKTSSAIVNRFTAYKVNAVQFVSNLLELFFRLLLIVMPLCVLSLFVLGMLIVSCVGVALARKKFLCTVTL